MEARIKEWTQPSREIYTKYFSAYMTELDHYKDRGTGMYAASKRTFRR
jgi:hypothetical protein